VEGYAQGMSGAYALGGIAREEQIRKKRGKEPAT